MRFWLEPGQALAQRPGLPFAHDDLSRCSVGHNKQKAALEVRLDLFDPRYIDQHLAARAEELLRRQGAFKFGQLVVHPERVFRCRRMHDAILHLEPEDLFRRHKQGASVFPADDFTERLRGLACRAQNVLAFPFFFRGNRAQFARAFYRKRQPLGFDGLEEIGKCVGLEGCEGVLVVPRSEDDERSLDRGRNRTKHLEALEPGHLYVEKQQVRPELFDLLNRVEAILSLADHSDFGMSAEQPDQPRASIRLIVNDQAPHHAGGSALAWQENCDARSTRLPHFYCYPALVLIERIEALRNILDPDSIRSSMAAVEFQDIDCGSDAVIFHSQTHLISVDVGGDPQVAWTGLRSQAVLQRIFNNGLKDQRGNLLHGDRQVDGNIDLKPAAEPSFFNLQIRLKELDFFVQ